MSIGILSQAGIPDVLSVISGNLNLWVHLTMNDPELDEKSNLLEFVEATYVGYVPQAVAKWSPPALSCGVAYCVSDPVVFTYDSPLSLDVGIQGLYLTVGRNGEVVWSSRRGDPPYPFGFTNKALTVILRLQFPLAT